MRQRWISFPLHVETLEDRCLLSGAGASLAALPLVFEPNVGQADPAVRYLAHGSGYALALTETSATLNLQQAGAEAVLQMEFVGPGLTPQITGLDLQGGQSNYLLGADPSHWLTGIPQYSRVQYQQVYPGIDLVFYGNNQGQLEYDFVLAPGADPGQVHLRFTGDDSLTVDGQGDLVLHFAGGDVVQQAPLVYQGPAGGRVPLAAAYSLGDDGTVGLTLGGFDARQALVIDPVLTYSTYLGGSGADAAQAIAVDATGTYLTGSTTSLNFPTANPFQGTNHGNTDAFVAKLNPAGSALVYSTYFGGSGTDIARGIAVDASGNAYIAGSTTSTDLPTVNALQAANAGGTDAFVAKLNSTGSALLYATYLGGSGDDQANGIALEGTNAVVVGQTSSTNFPTLNAVQASNAGGMDAFVAQLNSTGQALVFSTYLGGSNAVGGSGNDAANGVAVNASGAIGVAGATGSADFHTFAPFQPALHGLQDAFVARFTAAGGLVYATYLGGSNLDSAAAIALDAAGDAYVTGNTSSPDFPGGGGDHGITSVFVAELNPAGSTLVYSSVLGGTGADAGTAIAVDQQGFAYVAGTTTSTNFPTLNAVQPTYGGNGDAFVAALAPRGIQVYGTYLGGSGSDAGTGIAVVGDVNHSVVVTGSTTSTDFPTAAPLQPAAGGGGDAFVAQVPYAGSLIYNEASSTAQLVVRRSGNNLQLLRDGLLIWQLPLANVNTVLISGGSSLTVDNLSGGLFAPPGAIHYTGPAEFVTETGNGDVFTGGSPISANQYVVVNGAQDIAFGAPVVNLLGSTMDRFNADPGFLDTLHGGQRATLVGTPTHSIFSLAGVNVGANAIVAYGFGAVTANVTSASLFDSPGNDTLVATRSSATLSGPGYSLTANDVVAETNGGYTFSVAATASTGNDVAILSTSNSTDTLYAQPGYANLVGPIGTVFPNPVPFPSYLFTAVNFGTVRTYASGGTGLASLTGSPGNDIFVGTPTYSYLAGSNYLLFVSGFVQVNATGGGGSDAAFLYDSAGDDLFRGTSTYSFLSGTGFMNTASGFGQVTAVAGSGGTDTADLYAGPGDNYYSGQDSGGVLVGTGYSIAVNHFAVVRATASTDGTNLLFLSALDYVFQPIGNWH
jgi:hypothetical protein